MSLPESIDFPFTMASSPTNHKTSPTDSSSSHVKLSATYRNSSHLSYTTHHLSLPICAPVPSINSGSVSDKISFLSELRISTKQLQEEINIFLTQKMEEDKLQGLTNGGRGPDEGAGEKTRDEVEEEMYGEEGVEDDEEL